MNLNQVAMITLLKVTDRQEQGVHLQTTVDDAQELIRILGRSSVGHGVQVSVVVQFFVKES